PDEADRLTPFVRELDRGRQFRFAEDETLEDTLSRRLLALTPSLLPLADRIALGASHDVTVLINGETGTGKTYLAKLMHDYSPRRTQRFMAIPCGAISANLIETGEFEPVGSTETQTCMARLIVASNIDLEKAVALGKFRADLYFRLNVMSFHLPPLRERICDIEPLARGMTVRFARKFNKEI